MTEEERYTIVKARLGITSRSDRSLHEERSRVFNRENARKGRKYMQNEDGERFDIRTGERWP